MPHVQSRSQVKRNSVKNQADMKKTNHAAIPRDDLRTAFAGDANDQTKGSHLKSRRTEKAKTKTPVR